MNPKIKQILCAAAAILSLLLLLAAAILWQNWLAMLASALFLAMSAAGFFEANAEIKEERL